MYYYSGVTPYVRGTHISTNTGMYSESEQCLFRDAVWIQADFCIFRFRVGRETGPVVNDARM